MRIVVFSLFLGSCLGPGGTNPTRFDDRDIERLNPCLRNCDDDPEPRTCNFKFNLEHYTSNNGACTLCVPDNMTPLFGDCQCVLGDGVERYIKVVNRMMPGPSIQVCENDRVVIDVENLMEGEDAAIHWHGILQEGSQFSDGVPFVTQCPILSGTVFRYEWVAARGGTNFWHAHTGLQEMDGVYGSIVIREASDPQGYLYDEDRADHVIMVSDWMHEGATEHFPGTLVNHTGQSPKTILFNGKGWDYGTNTRDNLTVFEVEPDTRYRFRFINACGSACPSRLKFENHRMTVIAIDGNPIVPVHVDAIVSFSGERYDFVLQTDQEPLSYWMEQTGLGECWDQKIHQVAVLRYSGIDEFKTRRKPEQTHLTREEVVLNPFDNEAINYTFIGITDLEDLTETDPEVTSANAKIDHKIYLSFRFASLEDEDVFRARTFGNFMVGPDGRKVRSMINNITSVFPPSPHLSQYHDNPPDQFCTWREVEVEEDRVCSHLIPVDLGAVIELVIIDEVQVLNVWHPFHLHGTDFYVMSMAALPRDEGVAMTRHRAMEYDAIGKLKRNFGNVARKDTLAVPRNGYIIVRFRATNPGFWLLHCHFQYHLIIGMHLVFQVGEEGDLPPVPRDFPKCGNYQFEDKLEINTR